MSDRSATPNAGIPGKRTFLKLLGGSLLGGMAGAWASSQAAPAAAAAIRSTVWMHGHGLIVANPDRIELDTTSGVSRRIRGTSFSTNQLLCPMSLLPSPAGAAPRVAAILLRFRTLPGASIRGVRVYDGERQVAALTGLASQAADWTDQRLEIAEAPPIARGISVSIEVAFAAVQREIEMSAVGCELLA